MYDFIFYFVYKAKIKADGPSVTRYSASLVVAVYLSVHLGLLYSLARFSACYFCHTSWARANPHTPLSYRMIYLFMALLLVFITRKYYTQKKTDLILAKYLKAMSFSHFLNIVYFIALFLAPLLLAIFLENHSFVYCNS
jgi:hypothetical protein